VDTRFPGALAAVLVFNPTGAPRSDLVEVELSIPEDVPAFELVSADGSALPYELVGSAAGEFANVVLDKKGLRETFATIHEGRVAGVSIVKITVGQPAPTVNIDAVVSSHEPPDLAIFRQAEQTLAALEADPSVTHFHIRARLTRSSRLRFVTPVIPALGWGVVWVRSADAPAPAGPASLSPLLRPLLPFVMRIANSALGRRS
jgi:hypothetical protein